MKRLGYLKDRNGFDPKDPDLKNLTHISYSFAKVVDKKGTVHEDFINAHKLAEFKMLNPNIKILLAVGGWGAGNFSEAALNHENRNNFVLTATKIIQKYDMDGIDLDWEYPNTSESGITSHPYDKDNFTKLVRELKIHFNSLYNKKYFITFACGATTKMIESYDFKELNKLTDFMNLMTYDMGGSFTTTGYHTNLYMCEQTKQPGGSYYVDLFSKAGYDKKKIIYGCAFYARGGRQLSENNSNHLNEYIYGEKGIYIDYHDLIDLIKIHNLEVIYDQKAVGAYIYHEGLFLSFDTEQTITEKMKYVRENNLYGIMFWEHETDKTRNLIRVINEDINENTSI